jgi:hypothetical protein
VTAALQKKASDVYLAAILERAASVLSLMDRESFSRTAGCMDRTHWAWKFTDFPGARFQEGLCALSFLYATPVNGNPYYKSAALLRWIELGFDFWSKTQRPKGDFDEAYPFEHSLAATAFTSHYLSEAYRFVEPDLSPEAKERFLQSLRKAGKWLCENDETHGFLSNHLAAAATALYHAYQLTGEAQFETRARYFIDKILDHQSSEGWYDEYGGADPGYQTHGSYYLARYLQLSGDPRLPDSLSRSFDFLRHFIHPDLSLGGEYTSRNTKTYYPAAFEMMSATDGTASWICQTMLPSVETLAAVGLRTVDIYNLFPLLNNYVFAYLAAVENETNRAPAVGPSEEATTAHFPKAGLLKVRRPRYDLIVGLHKGGVINLFDRQSKQLVLSDCGYIGRLGDGKICSSQWTDPDRFIEVGDDHIEVHGQFFGVSRPVMDPYKFLSFRAFSLTLGRFKGPAYWVKSLLVKVLIYKKTPLDLSFTRRIELGADGIEIRDRLAGSLGTRLAELARGDRFTTIHMGSSRYFVPNELSLGPTSSEFENVPIDHLELGLEVSREARLDSPAAQTARPASRLS